MFHKTLTLIIIISSLFIPNKKEYLHEIQFSLPTIGHDNLINYNNNNLIISSNFSYHYYAFDDSFNKKEFIFLLSNLSYIINYRHNIIQVEYNILFYHNNLSLIIPSDLSLNYNLHLVCHIKNIESNISVDSLAFIHLNKYFKCIEYINIKEKYLFGVIIYDFNISNNFRNFTRYFFNDNVFNYNQFYNKYNKLFHPLFLKKEFYLNNKNLSNLAKLYISKPLFNTKSNIAKHLDQWKFLNIYNHYFCFCKGHNCLFYNLLNYKNSTQICKYKFYLYLIEENKYLYKKTDYLLADFSGDFQSLDDSFPIFQKLIKLKRNAYYMTINKRIFQNNSITEDLKTHIIKGNMINGDFLEKYFGLILRLKAVVSGAEYISFKNIFYNIEYITYISLTHGINFFKAYLFNSYYGFNRYNKIVVSTSDKIINLAKQYGWKESDLIKICLPKWDIFDINKNDSIKKKNKSIFFFFTWRQWKKNITDEMKLQSDYFKNLIELLNNRTLNNTLNLHGITLLFCLHHKLNIFKEKMNLKNNIKFIQQYEILDTIRNANLLVTDFSSIIFEFIYQNKPFVMFIPDGKDPNIQNFYVPNYFNLIQNLKDEKIYFKNKFFDINLAINKIIFYINNDFIIEDDLSTFYKSFHFNCGNNTIQFINYLEKL